MGFGIINHFFFQKHIFKRSEKTNFVETTKRNNYKKKNYIKFSYKQTYHIRYLYNLIIHIQYTHFFLL